MNAKKFLALFLALVTVLAVMVSCGGDPVETDPEETEPSDPKDPSNTQKPKVGVIVTVSVLALSAASVIAAVVLPKKRNRKNKK